MWDEPNRTSIRQIVVHLPKMTAPFAVGAKRQQNRLQGVLNRKRNRNRTESVANSIPSERRIKSQANPQQKS